MEGILFKIEAKDNFSNVTSQAKTEIKEIGGTANESSTSVSNFGSKMTSLVGITTAVVAGVAAVGTAMYKLVQVYGEAEQVQIKFNFAMQQFNIGLTTQRQLEQLAVDMQKLVGISDETTKSAIALGLQMGIESEQIERATKVAIDLSMALGVNLETAMRMLARGTEGNIGALSRYIPALRELNLESASTEEILNAVEQRVGGISEMMSGSVLAHTNRLKESFGDLKEEIGRGLAPAINDLVGGLSDLIEKMTTVIKQNNDFAEIQKSAAYQALYNAKSQQLYEKAIKEGWIGNTVRLATELKKLRNEVANEIKKWNDYQEAQLKNSSSKDNTKDETKNGAGDKSTAKKIETYFLPIPDIFKFYMNNMYQDFIYICENTASQVSDSVIEVIEADAYDLMTETEEIIKNYYKQNKEKKKEEKKKEEEKEKEEEKFNTAGFASSIFGLDFSSIEGFLVSLAMATDTIQMIGGLIQPLIIMVSSILYPVLVALIPLFDLVYSILGPLLKLFVPILAVLAAIVNNMIETLKAFGLLVYYIVTFQWGKISSIKPNYMTTSDINAIIATANAGISGATTTTTTGTGASYTAAATYHINVYVNTAALVGDTGIDEFAMLIWEKINLARERE